MTSARVDFERDGLVGSSSGVLLELLDTLGEAMVDGLAQTMLSAASLPVVYGAGMPGVCGRIGLSTGLGDATTTDMVGVKYK